MQELNQAVKRSQFLVTTYPYRKTSFGGTTYKKDVETYSNETRF